MMIIAFAAFIALYAVSIKIIEKRYNEQPALGTGFTAAVVCLAFAGAALALAMINKVSGFYLLYFFALVMAAVVSAYQDVRYQEVENEIPLILLVISIIYVIVGHKPLLDSIGGFLIGGGFLLLVALLTRGGMGGADIKLMAVYGLSLGIKPVIVALLIAFCFGAVIGLLLMLFRIVKRKQHIPFSPYLSIGAIIAYLYGDRLLDIYLNSLGR